MRAPATSRHTVMGRAWSADWVVPAVLVLIILSSACTTAKPDTAPTAANVPGESGGRGRLPANAEQLAAAARSDTAVGDPLAPELPVIDAAVTAFLQGEGSILVRFHRSSEPMVLGTDDCTAVATRLDSEGLTPPTLYEAAGQVPDETLSSAFINDIAEKIRHLEECSRAAEISFTHTVVARILSTAGVL